MGDYTNPDGTEAIRIVVSKATPELEAIPPVLEGLPVVFDVGGTGAAPHRLPPLVEVLSSESLPFIRSAATLHR